MSDPEETPLTHTEILLGMNLLENSPEYLDLLQQYRSSILIMDYDNTMATYAEILNLIRSTLRNVEDIRENTHEEMPIVEPSPSTTTNFSENILDSPEINRGLRFPLPGVYESLGISGSDLTSSGARSEPDNLDSWESFERGLLRYVSSEAIRPGSFLSRMARSILHLAFENMLDDLVQSFRENLRDREDDEAEESEETESTPTPETSTNPPPRNIEDVFNQIIRDIMEDINTEGVISLTLPPPRFDISPDIREMTEQMMTEAHPPPLSATPEEIAILENGFFSNTGEEVICPICQSKIEEGEKFITTKCAHTFHSDCIERWLRTNVKCPICRANSITGETQL